MAEGALKDSAPPYNEEAEMATLGALLLNFSVDLLEEVQEFVREEDFFKGAHRIIFKAITALKDKGEGVDLLTLAAALRASGDIDKVGNLGYVASLTERVPSTANVAHYAKLVQNASVRRSLLRIAHQLISDSHNEFLETRLIIEEAEKSIFNLNDNQSRGELQSAQEVIDKTISTVESRFRNKGSYVGIPSGFDALDRLTCGFQKSEMIIIGSRPSIGKTAFALSVASNIAIRNKIPCGFFTLEMSALSLMLRIVSSESRINSNSLRTGLLKSTDFNRIVTDTAGRIYDAPLIFQDTPNIPLLDLRSLSRRMVNKHGVQIVFIDYIGLVSPENTRQDRHEQISQISRSLKALARELDIPIVVLSQVGRQTEGKTPSLADLRESGALEQDADVVLFLHRERGFGEDDDHEGSAIIKTDLIVAKQRNGPTDTVRLAFVPQYTRFENLQDY